MAQPLHAHLILSSPLWRPETVPTELPPPPSAQHLTEQEQNFKLDCILVEKLRYKWSPDIIPKYDAMRDPNARHYFKSPMVQSLLRRTLDGVDGGRPSPVNPRSRASIKHANITPAFSLNPPTPQSPSKPQPQPQHSSQPSRLSLNTLSGRHRAPATPTDETLADKRERYCIDSVLATNQVTKYKPLIRPYDAVEDPHARGYFQKPGVKRVLAMTLGAVDKRSSEKIHSCKTKRKLKMSDGAGEEQNTNSTPPPSSPPPPATDKPAEEKPDQTTGSKPGSAKKSPRSKPAKSPRGPPEPTPEQLAEKEKSFLLDCIAVDSIAKDYSHCQPKLGPAIPAYNSQKDKHVKLYFTREQVDETLRKTQQDKGGCSIDGPVIDRFIESGSGYRYLHARNAAPGAAKAGHSTDQINGHGQFMSEAKPNFGFNGQYGYRRNTPWLRKMPSPFGVDPRSPTH